MHQNLQRRVYVSISTFAYVFPYIISAWIRYMYKHKQTSVPHRETSQLDILSVQYVEYLSQIGMKIEYFPKMFPPRSSYYLTERAF